MTGAKPILGVISGTANLLFLSLRLAENARKLKGFYSSFQDAPKALERLVLDLETMSLVLQQIEQTRTNQSYAYEIDGNELMYRCVDSCWRCVADISESMEKVGRYMAR